MSTRSLLVEITVGVMQKVFRVVMRAIHKGKTDETYNARVLDENYNFGCSPVSVVKLLEGLERGGRYLPSEESR